MGASVAPRTARVVVDGEVRLSPDLVIAKQFWPKAIKENNCILLLTTTLKPDGAIKNVRQVYFTNERAKSGRISLANEIKELGYNPKKLKGKTLRATVNPGSSICIHFGKVTYGTQRTGQTNSKNGSRRTRARGKERKVVGSYEPRRADKDPSISVSG